MIRKFDHEDRLIDFATKCIKLFNNVEGVYALEHLMKQLKRSTTGAA